MTNGTATQAPLRSWEVKASQTSRVLKAWRSWEVFGLTPLFHPIMMKGEGVTHHDA